MYLVGEIGDRYDLKHKIVKVKSKITKDDLLKAKNLNSFQVIDLIHLKYYDPEDNQWKKLGLENIEFEDND